MESIQSSSTIKSKKGEIENILEAKLIENFQPFYLHIINESYKHNVPKDAESHFNVTIVSDSFINQSTVQRHRKVYQSLDCLLKPNNNSKIHALSIKAKTIHEWEQDPLINKTPNCSGGEK